MNTRPRKLWVSLAIGAMAALPGIAHAQAGLFQPQEGINSIFLGVGGVPDFMGSDNYEAVPAIAGRLYFGQNRHRYLQLLGPQLSLNLTDSQEWQLGPQLLYRGKRDSDVEDSVVKRMREVDSELELGLFVARSWRLSPNDFRHRFVLRGDYASGKGQFGTVTANYWQPLSQRFLLNVGGGLAYGSSKWTDNYFGIHGSDIALYPSLGGQSYKADGGLYDFRLNTGVIYHVTPNWHVGAGIRYSRLQNDAADSPIVTQHGDRNQYIFGGAVGYAWQ